MLNFETQKAVYWLPNAARTSERDRAAPLQTILNWWLPVHDRTIVHAAAVGTEAGSVLLLGKSGAGKSTLALACVQAGLHYLGDDLCAISETDPPIAQSLYCSAKLRPDNLSRFPDFASLITNSGRLDSEKAIGYIRQASVRASSPVRHLVVLGQKGCREPAVVRISGATAFRAFAPSTFHNFPGHGKDELAGLAALVARVPCYQMDLAMDFEANAEALRELLASTPSRG